ncbi:MAG: NAD(P)-dependent oxidoreductase [Chloroflexota bacterium]|nr:NAD(P)-dependent oxidoreductase [Chloroflexota bacterium]MDE2908367.1 NAD(P)-dependent oxidoreductase [Chloroflexota bacterium]
MRVFITGGAGHVGQPIRERFAHNGWDVHVIDTAPDPQIEGISYAQCDIRDFAALSRQVEGCDAIAHLAAIPSTMTHPDPTLFSVNVTGTYNVFEAAERAGIKRIAQASSINAFGGYWGCDDRQYDYFPLDEAHPLYTTDAYSFSKQLVEEIAAYYQRRSGIDSVSFRFPAVWSDANIAEQNLRESLMQRRQLLEEFLRRPAAEQRDSLAEARARALDLRARRVQEYDAISAGGFDRDAIDDWLLHAYFFDRFSYWAFIHTDDSTHAFEKALTADFQGAHALFVNSDLNYLNINSEALLSLFFPDVSQRSKAIQGADALVSIDRARDLIGFEPSLRSLI